MTHEELKKLEENIDKYKKALTLVYADGDVTSVERNRLISLKNELGLSDSLCMVMESNFHEVADQDTIDLEKAKKNTQKTILTVLGKDYDELNKNKNWIWKDYDDLSGQLESPDGKSYFSYDWTTKEYKTTPESSWDSFIDADPERDTSLSAFKNYAENFVRNNIAKDNDIVFEREYIDTSKEMEGEIMSNETLADKYMRMNKLFEKRKSREGSGNPMSFEELYKWTEEEFPTKDSSEVLKETVGRMIMDNVSHEEFNVEYYDDVYGFGDGADFRWNLSFKAADALLSGDVLTLSDAQELIYKESRKMFEELKQNPNYKNEIELTDRINAAFKKFVVIHAVTFPCGFTFPKEIYKNDPGEIKREEYRWKIYERIKEKFGFNDNDTETEYFKGNIPSDSSFNIAFAVSVPKEIKTDAEKVNEWIESVENFVKDECGCTFINWQGGERLESIYSSEKAYRMEEELKNDLEHPSSKVFEKTNVNEIKEYCDIRYNIDLTDVQAKEIYDFYNMNNRYTLEASSAGNLYIRDHYEETIVTANAELLKAGNYLRSIKDDSKESFEYLLRTFNDLSIPEDAQWFTDLLEQSSYDSGERIQFVSDVLSTSFATLNRTDEFWKNLLDYGADPKKALRVAAADAFLGDNLNWLLDNVPESYLNLIFSDNGYADAVFDIAKSSVRNDKSDWVHSSDIGFRGFKRIAELCGREVDADRFYGELLESVYNASVVPAIYRILDKPELLAEKMNAQRIHSNEPVITESQTKAILDYCNYEDIMFYLDKNGEIHSLDISEDFTGVGMLEDNFGILANGIEYANKAKYYEYQCYAVASYKEVKDLWNKEKTFYNPEFYKDKKAVPTFESDIDKMYDFDKISKEEFLASYSYISEKEYEATKKTLNDMGKTASQIVEELKAKGEKLSDTIPDYYTDVPSKNEKDSQMKENPVEIIKKVASEKEAAEVPEKFKIAFRNRMISRTKSPDPFIVARAILKEWQTSKPEYVPVLNEYLRKQGCTTETGFEKFFKTINAPETKQERKLYNDIIIHSR